MKKLINTSTLNLFFRFLTLGAKFLLTTFVIKYISTEDFGIFKIITTTLALAIYLLGLDFYTFSQRDILQGDNEEQGSKIKDQFTFYFASYILFLPLLLIVFYFDKLDLQYIFWFYSILILDHFSQELYRILLVFKKSVIASILFFIKAGLWVFPLFALWYFDDTSEKTLHIVLLFWLIGTLVSILFGLYYFKKLPFTINFKEKTDWVWIRKGLKVCIPFFFGTIAYKVIEFSDIYMIQYYYSETQVGIYGWFVGMGNMVEIFVQSAILIVFAPKLVEAFSKDKEEFKKLHKEMSIQTILASVGFGVAIIIFLFPLVKFLDKAELMANYNLIYMLVGAKIVFNISMIYHYILYVAHKDRLIIFSSVMAAVANVVLNLILIPIYGIQGAAIATFVSFSLIFVLKFIFAKRIQSLT